MVQQRGRPGGQLALGVDRISRQHRLRRGDRRRVRADGLVDQRSLRAEGAEERDLVDAGGGGDATGGRAAVAELGVYARRGVEDAGPIIDHWQWRWTGGSILATPVSASK